MSKAGKLASMIMGHENRVISPFKGDYRTKMNKSLKPNQFRE